MSTKNPKGRVIRISNEVYEHLLERRGKLSWDAYFRRHLGLKDRKGAQHRLAEAWVLLRAGVAAPSKSKAKGAALMEYVRTGVEPEPPVRMREVV